MAAKRDYGSFAKASTRFLAPRVESLGYRPWPGGGFGREKAGWAEGFFLQQSQWGSGDFCVNIGIAVPSFDELWPAAGMARHFALLIAWRLSDEATEFGPERWFHATNREQLENSLEIVAAGLAKADSWFDQFQSFSDVVEKYRVRNRLPSVPEGDLWDLGVLNYGLLLLLAERKQEAARWLRFADELLARPTYWDAKARAFRHAPGPGLKLMKPSKDDDLRRRVVELSLAKAES